MKANKGYFMGTCRELEERALALLYHDEKYGIIPVETRMELYSEMRESVKRIGLALPELRKDISNLIRRYDKRGDVEGHKLCERFHTDTLENIKKSA